MDKKTKVFIEKARKVHGNKFDYSKVKYTRCDTLIEIICSKEGHRYNQTPSSHLRGKGCLKCNGMYIPTTEEWKEEAKKVHGEVYNYSKVNYIRNSKKVTIICKEHGEFEQEPRVHLSGNGCAKCSGNHIPTTEEWIEKAKEVHGSLYDYSKVKYTLSKNKVTIICKEHGEFEQIANSHLTGQGCRECSNLTKGWTNESWTKKSEESKYFDSFKVYVIRCWNEEEDFIKVGKTFRTVHERFRTKHSMPYNYEVLFTIEKQSAEEATRKEVEIQNSVNDMRYIPKIDFGGMYECFTKEIIKKLKILKN